MITIGTNINALRAERQLGKSSSALEDVFQRLSSGQRINRASDDAAGLAVSSSLNVDSRTFTQGIRNINDAISLVGIASGTLSQLSSIATRQLELATQAANGTFSLRQRAVMTKEANALSDEFNRLVGSTRFNGVNLLNGSLISGLRIQQGYGVDGSVSFSMGDKLARTVGDGSFGGITTNTGNGASAIADYNGDGKLDLITSRFNGLNLYPGQGNGSFSVSTILSPGIVGTPDNIQTGDFNGDGNIDIAAGVGTTSYIIMGNGNGSFNAAVSYAIGTTAVFASSGQVIDVNGDGKLDLTYVDPAAGGLSVLLGNGNGTFQSPRSSQTSQGNAQRAAFADYNGDGILDAAIGGGGASAKLLIGRGDGTFNTATNLLTLGPGTPTGVTAADFDHDGNQDIAYYTSSGEMLILGGNGDGTFKAATTNSGFNGGSFIRAVDLNGDGNIDLVGSTTSGNTNVLLGNGDGTFGAYKSYAAVGSNNFNMVADLNGDGALDIISSSTAGNTSISLANAAQTTSIARTDLFTQESARSAIQVFQDALSRITLEIGAVGAAESRLNSGLNTLTTMRDNYVATNSRILSADVAEESANLTRLTILQKAGAAVLAHANQDPALALTLLKS